MNMKSLSIRDFLNTNGRFPRSVFWAFTAGLYGVLLLFGLLSEVVEVPEAAQIVIGLALFPLFIVAIIVQIKRWHDLDKSGWWVLINFIPCLGGIWSLVLCGFMKGTVGQNRFGQDPLQ